VAAETLKDGTASDVISKKKHTKNKYFFISYNYTLILDVYTKKKNGLTESIRFGVGCIELCKTGDEPVETGILYYHFIGVQVHSL